ncbi:hypothetical protein BBK36DRAFT_1137135 [Trichoderma citrinoviride]|uniref:RRM domain-containing protein n=1 Tax=Trichoderma citrinoviride TaxID=58853 RepID=A0A2T4BMB5_9HYPO|nr:hypothetical protein BBK36DRAFT_1137135 [Trichoderma citrinoviride]PTB70464.1 hypothetical protein BBK36DRAFT_1137135 [Trichoderma citrinoviride]
MAFFFTLLASQSQSEFNNGDFHVTVRVGEFPPTYETVEMGDTDFDIDFYGDAEGDANEQTNDQPHQDERRQSGGDSRDSYDYRGRDDRQRDDEHEDDRRYESGRSEDVEEPRQQQQQQQHQQQSQQQSQHHGVKRKSEEQEPNDRPIDNGATAAIMISELNWWTTDDDIRGWLRKANCEREVKELTFSEHKVNGKSKGQAYVEFHTRQASTAAKRYIDTVASEGVQPGQKKMTISYWNPGVNPFRTLPKDAPARVKEQPRAAPSGSYSDRGNYGGFRGRGGMGGNRGGMNPNFNRSYGGNMGYNNNNMGGGGGFNGPMGGASGGGGTHYVFSGRSSPGGPMRGVQTIIRGRGGGGPGGGMMGMNPMGGMGMGMPGNMGMGMMGAGMPVIISPAGLDEKEIQEAMLRKQKALQEQQQLQERQYPLEEAPRQHFDEQQLAKQQAQEQHPEKVQAQVSIQAGEEDRGDDNILAQQVPEDVEMKNPPQQVPPQPQVPLGQNPPVNPASLRQAVFAAGALAPFAARLQEYGRHYYSGAIGAGFQGMPPNFPGGFGFGQQGGGGGGGNNGGDWGNPHGAKRPRPE